MSGTISLDKLPTEVVLNILSLGTLTWRDFHSLILTCRRTAVLAIPFLYRRFSTSFCYEKGTRSLTNALCPFLANLARCSGHRKLVKHIELDNDVDSLDLNKLTDEEFEHVIRLMRDRDVEVPWHGEIQEPDARDQWPHLVAILLGLCRDIEHLVILDENSYMDPDERERRYFDYNFPNLRRVSIDGTYNAESTRWGEDELHFGEHAFWMQAPALQRLKVRGAGRFDDHCLSTEDGFCGSGDIGDVERGSSSIRELVFTECMLPMYSMGGECKDHNPYNNRKTDHLLKLCTRTGWRLQVSVCLLGLLGGREPLLLPSLSGPHGGSRAA